MLAKASWPGNIRQLFNLVERLAALSSGPMIGPIMVETALAGAGVAVPSFNEARAEFEKVLKHEDLYIDIGASTKEEAEKLVSVGDYVSFRSDWREFGAGE